MSDALFAQVSAAALSAHETGLLQLFMDDPSRAIRFSHDVAGLRFDFSKLHLTPALMEAGEAYAKSCSFNSARADLLAGRIVNVSEQRPAIHAAMRAAASPLEDRALRDEVSAANAALDAFATRFEAGEVTGPEGRPYKHIIHLGIGGSALGPDMLLSALSGMGLARKLDAHVVANIDAAALVPVLEACDPAVTLVILTSKSFTTVETMTNAASVEGWMREKGVTNPRSQMVAVTANPDKAIAFGLAPEQILAFPEAVGGRYSLWSAVSLPVILTYGLDAYKSLLGGAAAMDDHFRDQPFAQNIPAIAALMDLVYTNALGADSRATFVYDDRLALLPSYLQQLETESNGKHVTAGGNALALVSSPVVWGGVGTDAQHAVFQLLHQGRHLVPTEFVVCVQPQHTMSNHHLLLVSNCLAQSAALMAGRTPEAAAEALGCAADHPLAIAKSFPGNRPSTTIVLEVLTPASLGALIAFYEHRVFSLAVLLGINPFDQMGVELGKEMAKALEPYLGKSAQAPGSSVDPSTGHLLGYINALAAWTSDT